MDLYSAAKRLGRPFVFAEDTRAEDFGIGARGLIGDGFSAALVRVDGAIDWLCMPRFDSPSVFGALLDPDVGGITAVTPARRPFHSLQRYDPDTNVLETLFHVEGQGVVRLTDFMPWSDDPRLSVHEVHRRIQCVEGAVDLLVSFDPRFEYGADVPHLERQEHGIYAAGSSGDTLVAVVDGPTQWEPRPAGGLQTTLRLRSGDSRWMVLSWNAPCAEPVSAYRPFEMLRSTRHRWREWSRKLGYDGPWRHHVMRSALALKLLFYAPTGGMVAAPTTSLPECIGGPRNWDYRFSWTRDSAMAIRACNLLGYEREAREFFHFVRDTLEQRRELQVMYTVDGQPVPEERSLPHLRGWAGSSPVRVGNGARDQVQLDTAGSLLDAAFTYERCGGTLTLRAWRHIAKVVEQVRADWGQPDHGIWEPRDGKRHNVYSKLMSWLALDRASRLAPLFGASQARARWSRAARDVHAELCSFGLDAAGRHFVMAYGFEQPDAALLLLPVHGFMDAHDPRVHATVDWIQRTLASGPFLYRYLVDDGIQGGEGAFVLCGFWLAEALALAGRLDEAQDVFLANAEASNHLGLLSEEVDPTSQALLGNFPQAFSHLGLVNAAARIDLGLRFRDEGLKTEPHFLLEVDQSIPSGRA